MSEKMSFRDWLKKVDKFIGGVCGLTYLDLPDKTWRDWYDDNMSPEDAAKECLYDEGFPVELL